MASKDNPFQPILIPNLNGGLNTRTHPTLVDDAQVIDALNVDFDQPGVVGTRPGTEKVADEVSSTFPGVGIKDFTKTNGSTYLVWKCAGTLYYLTPGATTNTSIVGSLSTSEVEMATYGDKIYISNATDDYRSWDGSTTATYASAPKGSFLKIFNNRAYIAGNPTLPSRVYVSVAGDPTTFTGAGTTPADINAGDGYKITGIDITEGAIVVSKGDNVNKYAGGIWYLTFDGSGNLTATQAPAYKGWLRRQTVSRYENASIYLSDDAVRSLGQLPQYPAGYRDAELSINIRPTIAALQSSWNTKSAGIYVKNKYYLSVPTFSSSFNDSILVYAYGAWGFWDSIYAGEFVYWNGYIYYSDSRVGQIWRINPEVKNDDGEAIRTRIVTKHYALGSPSVRKQVSGINARILADQNSQIRVSYAVNLGNYVKNKTWSIGTTISSGRASTTPGIIGSYYGAKDAAYGGTSIATVDQVFATRRWSFRENPFLISFKFEQNQLNKTFKLINFDIVARQLPYQDYYDVN